MLTRVDELAVSGIWGVEGDAIELPSQFMENFCWEWDVLQRLSCHVDTGATLPRELFDRMRAARNFQAASSCCGSASSRFSTCGCTPSRVPANACRRWPTRSAPRSRRCRRRPVTAIANSFSHLFSGGYAAGYYGYAWAEVLSADAYAAFEEAGVFNAAVGERFRSEILEVGGSRTALESFRAFRGRDPRSMRCCGTRVWPLEPVGEVGLDSRFCPSPPVIALP